MRPDLGLLQSEVADELGVDEISICNWELNRSSPQLRFVPKIIAFLGYVPFDTQCGSVGKCMVTCRPTIGPSQKELAHHLEVDASTLAWWERETE